MFKYSLYLNGNDNFFAAVLHKLLLYRSIVTIIYKLLHFLVLVEHLYEVSVFICPMGHLNSEKWCFLM